MRKEQVIMAFFPPLFVVYYNFRVDGSAILKLRLRYKTILYLERVIVYSLKLRGWGSYVESGCQRNTVGLLQAYILLDDQLE
jgi:hypothetical protein